MTTRGGTVLLLLFGGCGGIVAAPPATEVDEPSPGSDEPLLPATAEGIIALSHRETSTAILPRFRNPSVPSNGAPSLRGECRIAIDAAADDDYDAFESNASAGIVRAHAGERAVELRYDDDIDSYYGRTFPGPGPLSPDVPLEIEATGAAVPEFHTTVQLVRPIRVLLSPEAGIATDEAFKLTWEPTSDDLDVIIVLGGEGRSLRCVADGRVGSFEIEADRVKSIVGHPLPDDTLSLDVDVERSTELQAGPFAIQILDARPSHHAPLTIHRVTRSQSPLRSGHEHSIVRE